MFPIPLLIRYRLLLLLSVSYFLLTLSACNSDPGKQGETQNPVFTTISDTDSIYIVQLIKQSDAAYDEKNFTKAIALLDSADWRLNSIDSGQSALLGRVYYLKSFTYTRQKNPDYDTGIKYAQKALKIYARLPDASFQLANVYRIWAAALIENKKYQESILPAKAAVRILDSLGKYPLYHANALEKLANAYGKTGRYNEALSTISEAHTLSTDNEDFDAYYRLTLNNEIARWTRVIGGIEEALMICQDTYTELIEIKKKNSKLGADVLLNMARCYEKKGQWDKQADFLKKTLDIQLAIDEEPYIIATTLEDIGILYTEQNKYPECLQKIEQAYKIRQERNDPDTVSSLTNLCSCYEVGNELVKAENFCLRANEVHQARGELANQQKRYKSFSNLAEIYVQQGRHAEAEVFYKTAITGIEQTYGTENIELIEIYTRKCENFRETANYQSAIAAGERSLQINKYIEDDPTLCVDLPTLTETLVEIGRIHQDRYFSLENKHDKDKALLYYSRAEQSLEYRLRNSNNYGNSAAVREAMHRIQDLRLNLLTAFGIDDRTLPTDVFHCLEKTKGVAILASTNYLAIDAVAEVPSTVLKTEKELQKLVILRQNQHSELPDSLAFEKRKAFEALVVSREKLENFTKQIKDEHPKYYNLKYDPTPVSLTNFQAQLLDDQSVLTFFVGKSFIYTIHITKEFSEIKKTRKPANFTDIVTKFIQSLQYRANPTSSRTEDEADAAYAQSAHELYTLLISPLTSKLKQKLIVIPDGVLGLLPFEALIKARPTRIGNYSSYAYLLNDYEVSYAYSATLLTEMANKKHSEIPAKQLLGLAPFYRSDIRQLEPSGSEPKWIASRSDKLDTLPYSGVEVRYIAETMNGTALYGQQATLNRFRADAENYKIIHLSTHGKANPAAGDMAFIALADERNPDIYNKLYANELYSYSLNADMVVLSACETGTGEVRKGEGIISLSRAFVYAGTKSVFTTLWQVKDREMKDLNILFYRELSLGKPKDSALRNAKIEFIRSSDNPEAANPYYWAGFVGVGDMQAL